MKPDALPDMALGNAKAPVTIIEYASMTCPHCAHFEETAFPEIKKRYIDTGKVRYIFREFPLDSLAAAAFVLAHCAGKGDAGKYFAMVDTLFRQQRTWAVEKPVPPLMAIAKQAGLHEKDFNDCLSNQKAWDGMESVRQRAMTSSRSSRRRHSSSMGRKSPAPSRSRISPRSSTPISRADKGFSAWTGPGQGTGFRPRSAERSGKPPEPSLPCCSSARGDSFSGRCGNCRPGFGAIPGRDADFAKRNDACEHGRSFRPADNSGLFEA